MVIWSLIEVQSTCGEDLGERSAEARFGVVLARLNHLDEGEG